MNKTLMIIGSVIALMLLITVSSYNGIIASDELTKREWGNLQSTLQRRLDLIPNLVQTVKGYTNYEAETLQKIVEARSQATSMKIDSSMLNDPKALEKYMQIQNQLSAGLSRLIAISESYPDLKASDTYRDLMSQLEGTENRINVARQNYNGAVNQFNYTIRKFPASIVNSMFLHLTVKNFFTADAEAEKVVKVDFSK